MSLVPPNAPLPSMKTSRPARGSYSKLICLNCRARKIRCILPSQDSGVLQPSSAPQPPAKACTRCQQLGLECIIDRTILGRPSSKRKQTDEIAQPERNRSSAQDGHSGSRREDGAQDDVDVAGFVLAEVEDEIDEVAARLPPRDRPHMLEVFQSLLDPVHLLSTVIVRDKRFAAARAVSSASIPTNPARFLDKSLAEAIDTRLVWLRLYFPYIPTVSSLLAEVASQSECPSFAVSTSVLILVLCIIAYDMRAPTPLPDELKRQALQDALASYGQELLFAPVIHRYTVLALDLIAEYLPTGLVTRPNAAAAAVKGELYVTTMKRTAEKLEFDRSARNLQEILRTPSAPSQHMSEHIRNTLLWCRICLLDAHLGGLVARLPTELFRVQLQLHEGMAAVEAATSQGHTLSVADKFLYHRLKIRTLELDSLIDIKVHRTDLDFLASTFSSSSRIFTKQSDACAAEFDQSSIDPQEHAVKTLVKFEADFSLSNLARQAMSFAVFSSFIPPDSDPTVADVLQISDQIIYNIKQAVGPLETPPSTHTDESYTSSVGAFLARFGVCRPAEICRNLGNFVTSSASLKIDGISWHPPPRYTAAGVLYECKILVEENAARMKGWNGLCDDIDTQLLLFEDCARVLTAMDTNADSTPGALEEGSLFAACAKLTRSLATIMRGWRKRIVQQQRKLILEQSILSPASSDANARATSGPPDPPAAANAPSSRLEVPEAIPSAYVAQPFGAFDDIWDTEVGNWPDAGFDDWAAWPQVPSHDFWDAFGQDSGGQTWPNGNLSVG